MSSVCGSVTFVIDVVAAADDILVGLSTSDVHSYLVSRSDIGAGLVGDCSK